MSLLSQHPGTKTNPIIKEDSMNTELSLSREPVLHVSGNLKQNFKKFLIIPRQKVPLKINYYFPDKFQYIIFTAYRIKSGIACQIHINEDYLTCKTFCEEIKFHLILLNLVIQILNVGYYYMLLYYFNQPKYH
jgi:hypothetical protein